MMPGPIAEAMDALDKNTDAQQPAYRILLTPQGVPMNQNKVTDASGVKIGLISPDGRDGMIEHAQQFADAGIPFIFDPGQGMPMFDGDDLLAFAEELVEGQ